MSLTVARKGGIAAAEGLKMAVYQIAFDSSYPTGGEALDLTDDFDYVYGVAFAGNDTSADNAYIFHALLPAPATAITSSNVLVQVFAGASGANAEVSNATDLSAIGQTSVFVFGA